MLRTQLEASCATLAWTAWQAAVRDAERHRVCKIALFAKPHRICISQWASAFRCLTNKNVPAALPAVTYGFHGQTHGVLS